MPFRPRLTAHTRLVLLLGDPVGHSRSPELHNAAFEALGLDFAYIACRVAPSDLAAAVGGLRALGVAGANVTIPHKETILPLLDALTEEARGIGAVNTIVSEGGHLTGHNTDAGGFLDGLHAYLHQLEGAEMLVWGAGGAARAVVYALLTAFRPSRLTLVARRTAQADGLAAAFASHSPHTTIETCAFGGAAAAVRRSALLVNTTPLGMHPHLSTTPYPEGLFTPGQLVYDLVYTPLQTRLLEDAARCGALPITGLSMFEGQAARAFRYWTGQAFPPRSAQTVEM